MSRQDHLVAGFCTTDKIGQLSLGLSDGDPHVNVPFSRFHKMDQRVVHVNRAWAPPLCEGGLHGIRN